MALEGWEPLDFSAFKASASNKKNLANYIMANMEFTPLEQIAADLNAKKEGAPHDVGFLPRLFNLLSTPRYTIANALDESLGGHQADNKDSVLKDTLTTAGGVFTGAGKGFWAGLRGTFGSDEAASNTTDMTSFGDVLTRRGSYREYFKNPEESIADLKKANPGMTDQEAVDLINNMFKNQRVGGIVLDIVADPVNLLTFGGKGAVTAAGATQRAAHGDDLLKLSDIAGTTNAGEVTKDITKFPTELPSVAGPINAGSKVNNVNADNLVVSPSQNTITRVPEWFNFPRNPADINLPGTAPVAETAKMSAAAKVVKPPRLLPQPDNFDDLLRSMASSGELTTARNAVEIPPVASVPETPSVTAPKADKLKIENPELQAKVAARLTRNVVRNATAATGRRGWQYQAVDLLTQAHPEIKFAKTAEYLEKLASNPQAVKNLATRNPERLRQNLQRAIADDVNTAVQARIVKSENIVDEAAKANPAAIQAIQETAVPGTLNAKEAKIASDIVMKYTNQIVHKKAPTGMRNPEAYLNAISSGKNVVYSGPKQSNMLNTIINTIPQFKRANDAKRYEIAARILNSVEAHFISKGIRPHSGVLAAGSVPLRLSEVMFAVGPQNIARDPRLMTEILKAFNPKNTKSLDSVVQQAVEKVKAKSAVEELPAVAAGVTAGENTAKMAAASPMSPARLEEVATIAEKAAQAVARKSGAGETGAKAAANYLQDALGIIVKNPIDNAVRSSNLNTATILTNNTFKNYAKYANAPSITRAIAQEAQLTTPRKLANKVEGLVPEWLGARFNAAYKNQDMRPVYLREISTAKSTVARRAAYMNKLVREYGHDQQLWQDAFKGATGATIPEGRTAELSREVLRIMENLFGSSGLRKNAALDHSVVGRGQILMHELNNNLKRYGMNYKFTNKKTNTPYGATRDYSDGISWLNSWESWKVDNPIDFLYRIQNVVETTVREKIIFDDIAARWGNVGRAPGYTTAVNHPRMNGFYFSKDHASQITTMINQMNEMKKPGSLAMQLFDNVVSKWKSSVTIYMPGHHIRNLIGDTYFNWMAGVNSVRPYTKAINVMRSQSGKYEGLDDLGSLVSPDAVVKAIARSGKSGTTPGDKVAFHMKNGETVTNDMVYVSAYQKGLLPQAKVLEDIPDEAKSIFDKIHLPGKLEGRGQAVAHKVAESRDHFVRLAHYIDALQKSKLPFAQASENAARAVRKWHPDGMDLTRFERNVMRRMFPFYSWTRKSIPLIVESILSNPGKTMFYPKAQGLIQQLTGIDPEQQYVDPFPTDQLFPDWIRDKGIGPVMGGTGNYTIINPSNPLLDLGADLNHPMNEFLGGQLNPAARIPAEIMTEESLQNQVPIQDWSKYATDQIPGVSHASRFTNYDLGGMSPKGEQQGFGNEQAIVNFLTAMGMLDTGPYQKSAQFDLRDYIRSQQNAR